MKRAKEKGIDVIVTDHHEVLGAHPDCLAFVNPKEKIIPIPINICAGLALH